MIKLNYNPDKKVIHLKTKKPTKEELKEFKEHIKLIEAQIKEDIKKSKQRG